MVEVAEIAEGHAFFGEAFQEIVSNSGVIALIFKDNDQHVIEMFWSTLG
jgi:hypothetical protein